jgi:hypothetical protein
MPIKTLRFPEKQLAVHEVYGKVTLDQFESTIVQHNKEGFSQLTLWDASSFIGEAMSTSVLERFARSFYQKTPNRPECSRVAVVAPRDLIYGMTRMFESFSQVEKFSVEHRVFRSRDEAMEWLSVEQE